MTLQEQLNQDLIESAKNGSLDDVILLIKNY
jgi:hypothetical protein